MSGHSKWSTIKHKKAIEDSKRGKIFTKFGRAISIAAKEGGGGDVANNFKLRLAVDKAKQFNMPRINIDRAIEKGLGKSGGESLTEAIYEGFGPHETAVILEVVTDNKNRTASEIKNVFEKAGGRMGQPGSVGFLFKKIGRIIVSINGNKDELMLKLIDLGAEDLSEVDGGIEVIVNPTQLMQEKQDIEAVGLIVTEAELSYKALNYLSLDSAAKEKVGVFLESLDDLDDVQEIYTNLKF